MASCPTISSKSLDLHFLYSAVYPKRCPTFSVSLNNVQHALQATLPIYIDYSSSPKEMPIILASFTIPEFGSTVFSFPAISAKGTGTISVLFKANI